MKKEISTTPIIIVLTVILSSVLFLLEYAAFDSPKQEEVKMPKPAFHDQLSDRLTDRILKLVEADSTQTIQIQLLTARIAQQIKRINHDSKYERRLMMDSLRMQLKPILSAEQFKRLEFVSQPPPPFSE